MLIMSCDIFNYVKIIDIDLKKKKSMFQDVSLDM